MAHFALGKNYVADCFAHWHIISDATPLLKDADVIITHEFGDQHNVSLTTLNIVARGADLAHRFNKPMICQFPGQQVAELAGIKPIYVIERHLLKPGEYLDTEEVNRQAANVCKMNGWKRAIVVAHPHHEWRAAANLERHGISTFYPKTSDIPYDPSLRKSRPILSTPALFVPREILARLLYLKKGWI